MKSLAGAVSSHRQLGHRNLPDQQFLAVEYVHVGVPLAFLANLPDGVASCFDQFVRADHGNGGHHQRARGVWRLFQQFVLDHGFFE